MSLRMNLYGCDMKEVIAALASNDEALLQTAETHIAKAFSEEEPRSLATAWLRTLITQGHQLREERKSTSTEPHGGLIVNYVEAETHVYALLALVQALADDSHVSFANESSTWNHSAIEGLSRELSACHFSRSSECPMIYHECMVKLLSGTPLFGDSFSTSWAFYSVIERPNLEGFLAALDAAKAYERKLPDYMPEELRKEYAVRLSPEGCQFVDELSGWLHQINDKQQDAFVLWA